MQKKENGRQAKPETMQKKEPRRQAKPERTLKTPREAAADALILICDKNQFSHLVLRGIYEEQPQWSGQEKAFFTRLSEGTLERLITLDAVLDTLSKTPVRKMKPWIRSVLRLSLYQILYMDQVPPSAACNEAVNLAASRGFSGLKGFVNGVLRNAARQKTSSDVLRKNSNRNSLIYAVQSKPLLLERLSHE